MTDPPAGCCSSPFCFASGRRHLPRAGALLVDRDPPAGCRPDVVLHFAVATSLFTILPTSTALACAHHSKGALDVPMFRA